jgi:hypothetical protein
MLLLCSYLLFAPDDKELATCRFLDQLYDYRFSQSEQLDTPDDNSQQATPPNTPVPEDEIYDSLLWRRPCKDIRI